MALKGVYTMSEMVEVILYDTGEYEVSPLAGYYAEQLLYGSRKGLSVVILHCAKATWKKRLIEFLDTSDSIDRQIERLQQKKKTILKLKEKLLME